MSRPTLLITGCSGFVGRHLLEILRKDWRIIGLARRSRTMSRVPDHRHLTWIQCDIGDPVAVGRAFRRIRDKGGADVVIHLAAHYDFTGVENEQYWHTNVRGLRYVLNECRANPPRRFVFASSTAACGFPVPGGALNEDSPADGKHIYSVTKRIGEQMLQQFADSFPSTIVRFAALFSDWCEYPPLFSFLRTWTSDAWNRRILAGRGASSIPYMHIRDAGAFFRRLLARLDDPPAGSVLLASPHGAVSHRQLFQAVSEIARGAAEKPLFMPRSLCGVGMHMIDGLGRAIGQRPFERPWMARYIDQALTIDPQRTHALLDWSPRERLTIVRRLPFLLENLAINPSEWYRRNEAALKPPQLAVNLLLHRILEGQEKFIVQRIMRSIMSPESRARFANYQRMPTTDLEWNIRVAVRHLINAVRTQDGAVLGSYCRDLAERRHQDGFGVEEVREALALTGDVCSEALRQSPEGTELLRDSFAHVTMKVRFACDQLEDCFEKLESAA